MKKLLLIGILTSTLYSCTSLNYTYNQEEFIAEYQKMIKNFDNTLSSEISSSKIKYLKKNFIYLKRQLNEKNENFERINEPMVNLYNKKIDRYLMIIEDLKD